MFILTSCGWNRALHTLWLHYEGLQRKKSHHKHILLQSNNVTIIIVVIFRVTSGWAAVSPLSLSPPQWSPSPHPAWLTRVWVTPASAQLTAALQVCLGFFLTRIVCNINHFYTVSWTLSHFFGQITTHFMFIFLWILGDRFIQRSIYCKCEAEDKW